MSPRISASSDSAVTTAATSCVMVSMAGMAERRPQYGQG
jgi:hypothetical protein